jgi:hypothetical protein
MSKERPEILLKTDSKTVTLELGREGKFSAKARGCGARGRKPGQADRGRRRERAQRPRKSSDPAAGRSPAHPDEARRIAANIAKLPGPDAWEFRTDAGPIDPVFINERGRLTIVECKLWKNPEAWGAEIFADYVRWLGDEPDPRTPFATACHAPIQKFQTDAGG